MKDIKSGITYRGKEYPIVFNLNVMEAIQEEYGTIEKWGELTDGATGEPDARAVKFGFCEMLNEGIDIHNSEHPDDPLETVTLKQVGRMITEVGLTEATRKLNDTVIQSTQSTEKNA